MNPIHVPCRMCGEPTVHTATKACDSCWELERRVHASPDRARAILAATEITNLRDATAAMEAAEAWVRLVAKWASTRDSLASIVEQLSACADRIAEVHR